MADNKVNIENLIKQIQKGSIVDYQIGEYVPKDGKKQVFVLTQDGVFLVIDNEVYTNTIKISDVKLVGLPKVELPSFKFKLPKIPFDIFNKILKFFNIVYDMMGTEAYVTVYFDKKDGQYHIDIPEQKVSGGLVEWEDEAFSKFKDDKLPVLEVHSHHTMTGHFSSIDDEYQKSPDHIHLVIGSIKDSVPSTQIRVAYEDFKHDIELEDVFDVQDIELDNEFDGWEKKLKKNNYSKKTEFDSKDNVQVYERDWWNYYPSLHQNNPLLQTPKTNNNYGDLYYEDDDYDNEEVDFDGFTDLIESYEKEKDKTKASNILSNISHRRQR